MKITAIFFYWIISILLTASLAVCLGYTFPESLFMAAFFLPEAFFILYCYDRIRYDTERRIKGIVYMSMSFSVSSILFSSMAHFLILCMRGVQYDVDEWYQIPDILLNPVFIAIVDSFFAAGNCFLWIWLSRKFPEQGRTVTFVSDRHKYTVYVAEILYIESNDTLTTVVMNDGTYYRNRTSISHWENILGDSFIRIHRSYLVNRMSVVNVTSDSVYVGDAVLPLSRSYRDRVRRFFKCR